MTELKLPNKKYVCTRCGSIWSNSGCVHVCDTDRIRPLVGGLILTAREAAFVNAVSTGCDNKRWGYAAKDSLEPAAALIINSSIVELQTPQTEPSKILKFPPTDKDLKRSEMIDIINSKEVLGVAIICQQKDGSTITGWFNMTLAEIALGALFLQDDVRKGLEDD